ncbi:MAG: Hsp20/alpha crystallin family protein [Calditrichia bacterium]
MNMMDYGYHNPWADVDLVRREMKNLFESLYEDIPRERRRVYPPVNIYTKGQSVIVMAELPGIDPAGIHIFVSDDTLEITGTRGERELRSGEAFHRQERRVGEFRRAIRLPFMVDSERVEAKYKNGIIRISLSRLESAGRKKIEIKTNL